jgi:molybdate transport system regulatory protein
MSGDHDKRKGSPALAIRVRLGTLGLLGPGKVRLMELIGEHGSISAAGRAMGMSYRRAWMLVDNLNGLFLDPVIEKQTGGHHGGGAVLTKLGRDIIARYRRIERTAAEAAARDVEMLLTASRARNGSSNPESVETEPQ